MTAGERFAMVGRRRSWPMAIVATMVLAIASTGVLILVSLEDQLRWRPLPPGMAGDALVSIAAVDQAGRRQPLSPVEVGAFEDQVSSIASVSGVMPSSCVLQDRERVVTTACAHVSDTFWDVVGVRLALVTPFRSTEDVRAAVVSARFARQMPGRPADVRGVAVTLRDVDRRSFAIVQRVVSIVGVAPDEFYLPGDTDVWLASPTIAGDHVAVFNSFDIWARLQQGSTVAAARPQVERVLREMAVDGRTARHASADVRLLATTLVVADGGAMTLLLVTAIALVVIGWLAVGTLLASAFAARRRELCVRLALGATPLQVFRPIILQLLGVAAVSWAVGVGIASWCLPTLVAALPLADGRYVALRALGPIVTAVFTLVGVVLSAAVFWRSVRKASAARELTEQLDRSVGPGARRGRRLTFGLSLALMTACVYVAILLVLVFGRLYLAAPGFDPGGLVMISAGLPWDPSRPAADTRSFYEDALTRIRALPAVRGATAMSTAGLMTGARTLLVVKDPRTGDATVAQAYRVEREFFRTLSIPLRAGRLFGASADREIVINERLAVAFWRGVPAAIGQCVELDDDGAACVIGVVGDIRDQDPRGVIPPQVFRSGTGSTFLVRAAGPIPPIVRDVTAAIQTVRADARVGRGSSYALRLWTATRVERTRAVVMTLFAGVALLIGLLTMWGHVQQLVAAEWRAAAIVRVLGAERMRLFQYLFAPLAVVVALGGVVGIGLGAAATQGLRAVLVATDAWSPLAAVFTGGVIVLGFAAVMGYWLARVLRVAPGQILAER